MNNKIAVIDCGTNTFNMGIAVSDIEKGFNFIFSHKVAVFLGTGGIHESRITNEAFDRGICAINELVLLAKQYNANSIHAIGTAAIRDAVNGAQFIEKAFAVTGVRIQFIDGIREAELISKAACYCIGKHNDCLIMDIGGGSNEFILHQNKKTIWQKSYRLGVSRMHEMFGNEIESEEGLKKMNDFIKNQLSDLFINTKLNAITKLVGCSGSFDTFVNASFYRKHGYDLHTLPITTDGSIEELKKFCIEILEHPQSYCNALPGIPEFRKQYMKYSCALVLLVIANCNIQSFTFSAYSMKEGFLIELFGLEK